MFTVQNDNELVECPYNRSHRMLRKRLQTHLIRCRILYPDVELQKCPFNTTHLVPEPEFTCHVSNCPDRRLITQYTINAPEPKDEDRPKHKPIESEENWDDTDVDDYDPKKYLATAPVLRKPEGNNATQRRAFLRNQHKYDVSSIESENIITDRPVTSKRLTVHCSKDQFKSPPPPPVINNWHKTTLSNNSSSLSTSTHYSASARSMSSSERSFRSRSSLLKFSVDEKSRSPTNSSSRYSHLSFKSELLSPSPKRLTETSYSLDDDPYYKTSDGDISSVGTRREYNYTSK